MLTSITVGLSTEKDLENRMETSVLKQVDDILAPFIVELFNRSLSEGHFPAAFKGAFITPTVKKAGLDATDVSSYRPISNLPVLSKLLERLVVRQLMEYLSSADLLPSLQSSFRPRHSTETAVLRVLIFASAPAYVVRRPRCRPPVVPVVPVRPLPVRTPRVHQVSHL